MLKLPDILGHNNSNYPLLEDVQLKGGAVSVADKTARDAIPYGKRKKLMIVSYVDGTKHETKKFIGDITTEWGDDLKWVELFNNSGGPSVTVVDDLTTGGVTSALSAEQGKILNNSKVGYEDTLIHIGQKAGEVSQHVGAVALGINSGSNSQSVHAIALGAKAGERGQGREALAIGFEAGKKFQGSKSIAIGFMTGNHHQGSDSIAVGNYSGVGSQGSLAIVIGAHSGKTQLTESIILGNHSGMEADKHSIIIGNGVTYIGNQSLVLSSRYPKQVTNVRDNDIHIMSGMGDLTYNAATSTWNLGNTTNSAKLHLNGKVINTGGKDVLTKDIVVAGVTVGAVDSGTTLQKGMSLTEVVERIMRKKILATYVKPSAGLTVTPTATKEIGSTVTYSLTPQFRQRDAGGLSKVEFFKGTISLFSQQGLNKYDHVNQTVHAGIQTYKINIEYLDGPIKKDSLGDPSPSGSIKAGTISKSVSVHGDYYRVYGAFSTVPADGVALKAGGTKVFGNSITLKTGSTAKKMIIAIPATMHLVSVHDADALNADLTSQYVLDTSISTLKDGGGNDVAYKTYVLSVASPYDKNHNHKVIIN